MVRSLLDTYQNSLDKVALDRDLALHLLRSKNQVSRDVGWRIQRCADDHNVWFIQDDERGWLHGRFWKCNQKLCSFCLQHESRRRRRKLLDAIENLEPRQRKWHFVTFTIENPSASIITTRTIVNDAWAKFRKRGVFAEVRAACKSEEFTVTRRGFHYHIHSLLDDPRNFKHKGRNRLTEHGMHFRREWTECVEASNGQSQNLFGYQTADGFLRIDFREVQDARQVVNELGKYITKSTSFRSLSRPTINELAAVKRWHRMFELLGELRKKREPKPPRMPSNTIVHTKGISDGENSDRWWFEKKREDARYFAMDALENRFHSHVYDLVEMRAIVAT